MMSAAGGGYEAAYRTPSRRDPRRRCGRLFAANGADEEGTHEQFKTHCRQLVDPKIEEHRGRIVKNTGDGMLVEFPSAVDAVCCAAEVQRAMVDRNAETAENKRIRFRIGVNLGDVIAEADDIYGDGVNIAARLEALAEPGGICISRVVRDQIRDKLPYSFEDRGEQNVKNIARPVRTYAMSPAYIASTPLVEAQEQLGPAHRSMMPGRGVIAASLAAVIGIGLAVWWAWPNAALSPVLVQAPTNPHNPPAVASTEAKSAPRLSFVVLPFENLSRDPDQEYFADGITDDLTTDLSRISGSFVIARNTAFTYKGKPVEVKQIGRELGVHYVLEGSVRRTGDQVRVNVQLIDAETGAHLWADRFDTDRANLAEAQSEITGRLARTLKIELVQDAGRRIEQERAADPNARDLVMRGWAWSYGPVSVATRQEAQRAFEQALEIDPVSVDARIGLATILLNNIIDSRSSSAQQDQARAEGLLLEALELGANGSTAHQAMGNLRRIQNRLTEARIEGEAAIALDRNNAGAHYGLGQTLMLMGKPEAAVPYLEKAIRLNPHNLNNNFPYWALGACHLFLGHLDEAIDLLRKARAANPRFYWIHLWLAGALGFKGDLDEARAVLTEGVKLRPDVNSLARYRAQFPWNDPQYLALRANSMEAGLLRAGFSEE
jgi:adenylate cyclase